MFVPLLLKGSSTRPSQSLSIPSQSSGPALVRSLTALHLVVVAVAQTNVPLVRQAPSPGGALPRSLAHGWPKLATFSLTRPLQLLSSAGPVSSQVSAVPAQVGLHTPAVLKVH